MHSNTGKHVYTITNTASNIPMLVSPTSLSIQYLKHNNGKSQVLIFLRVSDQSSLDAGINILLIYASGLGMCAQSAGMSSEVISAAKLAFHQANITKSRQYWKNY